jgi:hypothetical protein
MEILLMVLAATVGITIGAVALRIHSIGKLTVSIAAFLGGIHKEYEESKTLDSGEQKV